MTTSTEYALLIAEQTGENSMSVENKRSVFQLLISKSSAAAVGLQLLMGFTPESMALADQKFYSAAGREHTVSFQGVYRIDNLSLNQIRKFSAAQKANVLEQQIIPLFDYLFGPLVHRGIGSPQRTLDVSVDWDSAKVVGRKIELPYSYTGRWLVTDSHSALGKITLPIPYNRKSLLSSDWQSCTDHDPDHQTESLYWYYWDPARWGCDHKEGEQFATVTVKLGEMTGLTKNSFPEYSRLLGDGAMTLTLAFGYVHQPVAPEPDSETDTDEGARQYRFFLKKFRDKFREQFRGQVTESAISQNEYPGGQSADLTIGHRFTAQANGISIKVNVVIAAGLDQIDVFAKSFSHDHDDVFAWFGHSRVGSGFDAARFKSMLDSRPDYYSISPVYQIIYWSGCNSYSYYTLPFFEMKGGSKNLDIIANGLPTYFSLNSINALITADTFVNWQKKTSYQTLIQQIEQEARQLDISALVAVLGDEDNEPLSRDR